MASALLVADYILATSSVPLTPMQSNKLSYISHGFTLALENEALFLDRVEAWKYGPVIPTIYYALREYGGNDVMELPYCKTSLNSSEIKDRIKFLTSRISDQHKKIIDVVMSKYGHFSGRGLSTMTHEPGTPWHQCYKDGRLGIEIPNSMTRDYYKSQLQV